MEGGLERLSWVARGMAAPRGPTRQPSGVGSGRGRKLRMAVAGERSRRSRFPVRHASSSRRGAGLLQGAERTSLPRIGIRHRRYRRCEKLDANRCQDAPLPVTAASMKPGNSISDDRGE
ncbi:hypothetical protein EJ074_00235 [Mesorhizobium sp. M3A.F.Ca.ET.080.04.2.1]|nr:hypothetical protein EJ074_00235 [Mesorhizobium sp. M3A.F.Ca.ET.080.04.2.1]